MMMMVMMMIMMIKMIMTLPVTLLDFYSLQTAPGADFELNTLATKHYMNHRSAT